MHPATNLECTFPIIHFTHFICRRCSSRSRRSSFGPRRILAARRPTPVSSTFTKSSATSRNSSTTTTRSGWGDGSLPQLPPAVPFLPYFNLFKPGCCKPHGPRDGGPRVPWVPGCWGPVGDWVSAEEPRDMCQHSLWWTAFNLTS